MRPRAGLERSARGSRSPASFVGREQRLVERGERADGSSDPCRQEVDAPHRLAWTFNGELYSFDLSAQKGGCLLVFTHVFDDRNLAAQTAAGWESYFSRLEPHLAGGFLSEEEAHEPSEQIHEPYAERFGVDPTPGRRFIGAQRAGT